MGWCSVSSAAFDLAVDWVGKGFDLLLQLLVRVSSNCLSYLHHVKQRSNTHIYAARLSVDISAVSCTFTSMCEDVKTTNPVPNKLVATSQYHSITS